MKQNIKQIVRIEFTDKEKKAIKNCVEAIDCEEVSCDYCPFQYNCGCMLATLREIIED